MELQEIFSKYNDLCFEGNLPPIPFKLVKARTFLGKYTRDCIRISTSFDLTERELEDVVIHEMIHYYIAFRRLRDTSPHGVVFRRIMGTINEEFGRNITVRYRCKAGCESPRRDEPRENWICVTQLEDGKWGVTSCIETRVPEMKRNLPKHYRLRSMEWFRSTDPFFNRYPRSYKPRIYKITRAELDGHLPGNE